MVIFYFMPKAIWCCQMGSGSCRLSRIPSFNTICHWSSPLIDLLSQILNCIVQGVTWSMHILLENVADYQKSCCHYRWQMTLRKDSDLALDLDSKSVYIELDFAQFSLVKFPPRLCSVGSVLNCFVWKYSFESEPEYSNGCCRPYSGPAAIGRALTQLLFINLVM